MLPWTRPAPHKEFEADARALLDALRKDIAKDKSKDKSQHDAFKNRKIWSGSWKRGQQQTGVHKLTLAGQNLWEPKCVWCERKRDLRRELDVEHYRPKGRLSEWQGDPLPASNTPPKEITLGDGYWWLAFHWENFSLACKTCNQEWKRNLFPVQSPRLACTEGVENRERPLLLDPASAFRTRDHFRWDRLGVMEGVSPEGRATIITCGLNRRGLRDLREKVAINTYIKVERLTSAINTGNDAHRDQALVELDRLGSSTEEFTSMKRWIIEEHMRLDWDDLDWTIATKDVDGSG